MNKIVGIKFTEYGKIHEYDSGHFVLKKGYKVLVETEQGLALGVVCTDPRARGQDLPSRPLRKVFRLATPKDVEKFQKKCQLEKEAYAFCYERVKERSLPMCLVSVERLYDGSKIMVYFTAEGRVDFRELVRDLVQKFHTRVESCGRQLCCSSFLNNFAPVSIRMAKEQNLSLNPAKISGMCGRLMCCLTYEREYYEEATKDIPKIGKSVETLRGRGKVVRQNVLKETLTVVLDSGEEAEVPYEDIVKNELKERIKKEP
jgi:cell fate regulator YaaT (PSP1 superfamily)